VTTGDESAVLYKEVRDLFVYWTGEQLVKLKIIHAVTQYNVCWLLLRVQKTFDVFELQQTTHDDDRITVQFSSAPRVQYIYITRHVCGSNTVQADGLIQECTQCCVINGDFISPTWC